MAEHSFGVKVSGTLQMQDALDSKYRLDKYDQNGKHVQSMYKVNGIVRLETYNDVGDISITINPTVNLTEDWKIGERNPSKN